MPPRVLIVYANPAVTATPVAPYGAERVAQALRLAGCDARVIAPWLEWRPGAALDATLDEFRPDLVGFSVRNVDDALVVRSGDGPGDIDTAFYLPAVRRLVRRVQARGIPVLLGGAAVSTMPDGLRDYLGVSYAISGPADDLVWRLGRALAQGTPFPQALPEDPRVLTSTPSTRTRGDAAAWRPVPGPTPRIGSYLALARARGGRVPVQLSAGCDRRCNFCVEASFLGWQARPRPVDDIVHEMRLLRDAGVKKVWLTASELNVPDARHAVAVLRALAAAKLKIDVNGFLQPAPVDDALLDAFSALGVDPAGLSWEFGHFDDALLRAGAGPANRASIDRLAELYIRRGHRTLGGSVLLGAHPQETEASIDRALDYARSLDASLPDGLGLAWAAGGRVYPAAPLGRWVRDNLAEARPHLYGRLTKGFVAPVVFCRPGSPRALFRRISTALSDCRGAMRPLNAEAPSSPTALLAEKWVNLAILHAHENDTAKAERAARAALHLQPTHPEALKQLGLLLANHKRDASAALPIFRRLLDVAPPDAHPEIQAAIRTLEGV